MKAWAEVVFYTLLILLPVNISKHFFTDSAFVHGILVDYYLPTIYLTDLLILTLLLMWLWEIITHFKSHRWDLKDQISNIKNTYQRLKSLKSAPSSSDYLYISLFLFLTWAGISIFGAQDKVIAIYRLARFLMYVFLALWMRAHLKLPRDFGKIRWSLMTGVLVESLLAVFQWVKGGTVFGFYFLGEPSFNGLMAGIARTGFLGETHSRAYGTFPHPNILGAYLALFLPWLLLFFGFRSRFLKVLALVLCVTALFFSFSRTAWVTAAFGILLYSILTRKTVEAKLISAARFGLLAVFIIFFLLSGSLNDPLSLTRRVELTSISTQMIRSSPLLGVGFGNFIIRMDDFGRVSGWIRFLQPVHNIFLLIGAETGIIGLILFLLFLFLLLYNSILLFRRSRYLPEAIPIAGPMAGTLQLLLRRFHGEQQLLTILLLINLFQLLILGLADHFLVTTAQGLLLLWVLLGLVFLQLSN